MTAHFHHAGQADDLVIGHYLHGDPSTGVVLTIDPSDPNGTESPEWAADLVPWNGDVTS